jgi:hypothetical protein
MERPGIALAVCCAEDGLDGTGRAAIAGLGETGCAGARVTGAGCGAGAKKCHPQYPRNATSNRPNSPFFMRRSLFDQISEYSSSKKRRVKHVNGQRATLADLKPGMTMTVTIGTDPTHASRINAEGVPVEGKPKK